MNDTTPAAERARLEALRKTRILDTEPDPDFDDIALLASQVCKVPIALVSFVDESRQWFKARVGFGVRETPREMSFCAHAIEQRGVFVIEDLTRDPRFALNPLVVLSPKLRFYAGAPLTTPEGHRIGTVCVMDTSPRSLDAAGKNALKILSRQAVGLLERRRDGRNERFLTMLQKALETMQLGVTVTGTNGKILFANSAEARLHGWEVSELIGQDASLFAPPSQKKPLTLERLRGMKTWGRETLNRRKDGTVFPAHLMSDLVTDANGEPLGVVTTCEDITARKQTEEDLWRARDELETKVLERTADLRAANDALQSEVAERRVAEQALRVSEARYRLLFQHNLAAVWRTRPDGRILDCNESFAKLLGYASREEVLSRNAHDFSFDQTDWDFFVLRLTEQRSVRNLERRLRRTDGSPVWILENVTFLAGEDEGDVLEGTSIDITDRKRAEDQLLYDAFHDALTGLANRALFLDRLSYVVRRAKRQKTFFAVLFIDLDRFKVVNDSLGHEAGDRVLVAIAERLKACVRTDDTIARLGGDEFVILLDDIEDVGDATRAAERIQSALAGPLDLEGQEIFSTASIGIALSASGYEKPEDLVRDADTAMYRAKALGRARYEVFDPAMRERALQILQLESDLRRAVERKEFRVHYQPIIALSTGRITGFEALVRWDHPQRGLVLPNEFIPLAEETGLIVPIGTWVLEQACARLKTWHERFPVDPPFTMSVNLSSRQFSHPDLLEEIRRVLRETGIDANTLTLEITETVIMENADLASSTLDEIKVLGVHLSIDDFGTGYSSLSYLHRFPLHKLKIDQSFIARLGTNPANAEIIRAIADLAGTLGLEVIAEGVETADQLERLKSLNCGWAQGFLFSEALDGDVLEALLSNTAP